MRWIAQPLDGVVAIRLPAARFTENVLRERRARTTEFLRSELNTNIPKQRKK
jgi:hypothetical protein